MNSNKFNTSEKSIAQHVKADLIDFLLSSDSYDLLASEVPFMYGNRWADLIAIQDEFLIGFEIKSKADSLKTLKDQLNDYYKVFNKVYIVVAEKFRIREELKTISKNIGIIIVKQDNTFLLKRKALTKASLDKSALLSLLWRKDLERITSDKKDKDIEALKKNILRRYSVKAIQQEVIKSLKSRYGNSYQLFLRDRGNYTTVEDIRTITKLKKISVF